MKLLKIAAGLFGIAAFIFIGFLGYMTLTDNTPEDKINLLIANNQVSVVPTYEILQITTYNIGYGGLDESQDFFADGGNRSRAGSYNNVWENINSVVEVLDNSGSEFFLLQEVDESASRSYKIDQVEFFKTRYPNFGYSYGINYDVKWVPVPVINPMGSVKSGLLTMSRYNIYESNRYQFPGGESWPVQIFELDRCFVETRYETRNGKDFVLLNLHLSAFDEGGIIREKQLAYLKEFLVEEYQNGNYIIAGGDWNHNLPGSEPSVFPTREEWPFWLKNLPEDYDVEGFIWELDSSVPTVRTLEKPYSEGYNFLAVIDGFLISDNIEIIDVEGVHTSFKYTDHNPVTMSFILR